MVDTPSLDSPAAQAIIQAKIQSLAEEKVNVTVTKLLNDTLASGVVGKHINRRIDMAFPDAMNAAVTKLAAGFVSQTNLNEIVSQNMSRWLDAKLQTVNPGVSIINSTVVDWTPASVPSAAIAWTPASVPGAAISGPIDNLRSGGIRDLAVNSVLTLENDKITVSGAVAARAITADAATIVKANIGALTVTGAVTFADPAFGNSILGLVNTAINDRLRSNSWDISGGSIVSGKDIVLSPDSLGSSVINSNLRRVGRLIELAVEGDASFGDTLAVARSRVGVNTTEPAGALSVWDDDAELSIRRYSKRVMYLGSTRGCSIALGIDGAAVVVIDRDSLSVPRLKLGGISISSSDRAPETVGTPGDLVVNTRPDMWAGWAWRCLGGNRWVELS